MQNIHNFVLSLEMTLVYVILNILVTEFGILENVRDVTYVSIYNMKLT